MNAITRHIIFSSLTFLALSDVVAAEMTKEQAIVKALTEHPGEVQKAYKEKKKGQDVWEVKINADDGKQWELYYDVGTGELVKAESE